MAGWYAVEGPVAVPDIGGFIVWGTAKVDVAEEAIPPAPKPPTQAAPTVSLPFALTQKLDTLLGAVERLIDAMPSHRSATLAEMSGELGKVRQDMALVLKATLQGHGIVAEQALKEERKRVAGYLDKFLESVGANVS